MRNHHHWMLALAVLTASIQGWGQTSASFPPVEDDEETSPPPPPRSPSPAFPPATSPVVSPPPAPPPPATVPLAPAPSPVAPGATTANPYGVYGSLPPSTLAPPPPPPPTEPRYLPYEAGMDIPEGYRVRRRRLPGFMISGGITFGASYAYGFGSAASNGFENGETWLVVPIVGPFAALAARQLDQCNIDVNDARNVDDIVASKAEVEECFKNSLEEALRLAAITADGVLQTLGASLFVGGFIGGEWRLERIEPRVTAGPRTFGRHGIGLGFSGTF